MYLSLMVAQWLKINAFNLRFPYGKCINIKGDPNDGVMIFYQGRQEDGEPEKKKASKEENTEEKHRLVHNTTDKNDCSLSDSVVFCFHENNLYLLLTTFYAKAKNCY